MKSKEKKTPHDAISITDLYSSNKITNLPNYDYDINSINSGTGFTGGIYAANSYEIPAPVPKTILVSEALALLEISEEDRQRLISVKYLNIGDNKEVKRLSEQLFKAILKDIIDTNTTSNELT